ncbi:MAG: cytochrome b/b6 domain-containing protein [Stellaceae bacterium]
MTSKEAIRTTTEPAGTLVWDPLVRFGHWALVAAFAVAYFSAEEEAGGPDPLHVWAGYIVGGIVVVRVLWGFLGSRHARFSDFVCSPIKALVYLRDLLVGRRTRRYVGHSPAGGAMVIALLVCLAATVTTGLIAYGEQGKGPLSAALVTDVNANTSEAEHRERPQAGGERTESAIAELHGLFANITAALVIAHILGVVVASFVHRENLVLAMINGRKRRA